MIGVLLASRTDPVSGREVASRNDAVAAALALQIAGADGVTALSAAPLPDSVAQDYLALGLRTVELIDTADPLDALAREVAQIPLVFTGMRNETGVGSGTFPYALAHRLGRPVLAGAVDVQRDGETTLVTLACPKGARRRLRVEGPLVLAINPSAPVALRHSWRDQLLGRVVRRSIATAPRPSEAWQQVPAVKGVQVLAAASRQSGHNRMHQAVAPAAAGGLVLTEGSAHDKARAVFDYLRRNALLDF